MLDGFNVEFLETGPCCWNGTDTKQLSRVQFFFWTGDAVDDDQSVKSTFGKPFQDGGGEHDVRLRTKLDFRSEHPDVLTLVNTHRVFWHFVVNEGYCWEIFVHDRPELSESERFDDV